MTASEYVMGGTLTERERLLAQAASQAPEARWLLDRIGVEAGWSVIDVGCGPVGILDLLAERVGPLGVVVGVEREPRFVEMAQMLLSERALTSVKVVHAEALDTGLPDESFDLVHARLVLLHQRDPRPLLEQMVRLARPGGWVAVQELDAVSFVCEPPHPAWTRLWEVTLTVTGEFGIDVHLGRRIPSMLRAVGLEEVQAEAHTRLVHPGEYGRTHLLSLAIGMRDRIVERGLLTESELADDMHAVQEHVDDPETVIVREMLVQAWGRQPG
jgi:ubiquinone/menaquinone biosynthesis C-methylase UbiE